MTANRPISHQADQADVLDMVGRLKKAVERAAAPQVVAVDVEAGNDMDFPAEFYQYFTFVKAA
jgi:hypothetical protein